MVILTFLNENKSDSYGGLGITIAENADTVLATVPVVE